MMSCPRCGGNNDICHLNGMCTRCGQEYTKELIRSHNEEHPSKKFEIRIFGIKIGEIWGNKHD